MKYAVLIYEPQAEFDARSNERSEQYWSGYLSYGAALQGSGLLVGASALQVPAAATTVRMKAGTRQVTDGPFAETKEQLGGFYLIDAPTLDEALDWAERCPAFAAGGALEVRPVLEM